MNQPNSNANAQYAAGETIIVNPVDVDNNKNLTVPEIGLSKSIESMHAPNRQTNQINSLQIPN